MAEPLIDVKDERKSAAPALRLVGLARPFVKPWRPAAKSAFRIFLWGFLSIGAVLAGAASQARPILTLACAATAVLFALGAVRAATALIRMWRGAPPRDLGWAVALAIFPGLLGTIAAFLATTLTVFSTGSFGRGRQLRRRGELLLPPLQPGDQWTELPLAPVDAQLAADAELRGAVADRWRENGKTEHASVAAFARLSLDLVALGAPPALLEAANRDAADELRHAKLCFSLARALDGKAESPGAFADARTADQLPADRALALCALAVDSLVDGALHEGLSARVIARLAERCRVDAIGRVLGSIARDEARHSAHGWDVVEWCLREGGSPVARALDAACAALPARIDSGLPEAAKSGAWEPFGLQGEALEAEEHAKVRAELCERVRGLTAPHRLRAA